MANRLISLISLLLIAAVLAAGGYYWYARHAATTAAQAPPAPPPPEVGFIVTEAREVPLPYEYAGRVAGYRDVEVRPRVGGILLKREYEEGSKVTEGQVLFRIDPRPFEVALERAQAQLLNAQATLRQTEDSFQRIDELFSRKVATAQQRDNAQAARDQARASIKLAEVEIESAKLNLGYTTVNAPVSGITALTSPAEGTLVQAQTTLLTTITILDPAYVLFSFTDVELQAFRELNAKREHKIEPSDLSIELHYGDGTVYPEKGRIDVAAQRVDPSTGTIQARSIFPNPDGVLLPGQFVRIVVRGVSLPNAITIPQKAVSQGPQGPFVYVLGPDDEADQRPIKTGQAIGPSWVVEQGLKPGERVAINGLMAIRPGMKVRPVRAPPAENAPQAQQPGDGQPQAPQAAAAPEPKK